MQAISKPLSNLVLRCYVEKLRVGRDVVRSWQSPATRLCRPLAYEVRYSMFLNVRSKLGSVLHVGSLYFSGSGPG